MTETETTPRPRRRASRAAGPASGAVEVSTTAVPVTPSPVKAPAPRPAAAPPRRQPPRARVAAIGLAAVFVALLALGTGVFVLFDQQRNAAAAQAREQRFVDTATQTVVNMFSYTPDTIDQSVDQFVDGTSGPLRDMMSKDGNVENLKAIFRDTNASSEAVVNGAALENIDEIANNANVLVSVRVTVTDIDGTNKPSQPYRLRIEVHEDDNGHMTGYDIKYPDGGN